ncbi:MESD-like protein [Mya arenaria]|uniref:MESD-like protein n=1 Tax=Mya arenaria TaxID=6604 RepID=A0ABY7G804_MYAAR|nr:MESD-like protein [Mya arenaria]
MSVSQLRANESEAVFKAANYSLVMPVNCVLMRARLYVVSENRVIFMLNNGAMAWEIKDFLVNQDRCEEVTIEGKSYPGKV